MLLIVRETDMIYRKVLYACMHNKIILSQRLREKLVYKMAKNDLLSHG